MFLLSILFLLSLSSESSLIDKLKKTENLQLFKSLLTEKIPAADLPQLFPTLITETSPTNLTPAMYLHLYNELLEQKRKLGVIQEAGRSSFSDLQHFSFHIDEQFKILEKQKPNEVEKKIVPSKNAPFIRRQEKWTNLKSSDNELADEFDPLNSYNFIIPPGQISCFSETAVKDNEVIKGAYYVTSGEDLQVSLKVTNHLGNVLNEATKSESVFKYTALAAGTRYEFCFSNSPYSNDNRVVTFGLSIASPNITRSGDNTPLSKVQGIRDALNEISREQNYLGIRYKRHQSTQESTNKRLNSYTFLEGVTYFLVCGLQICYLQSLVAKKTRGILG